MTGWPWPLDSVQYWFEDLWGTINGWITSGLDALWTSVSSALNTVSTWISDGFSAAWKSISAAFDTVKAWFDRFFTMTWEFITASFSTVEGWFGKFFGWTWELIIGSFTQVSGWVSGAVTSLVGSVSAFFSDLWGKVQAGFTSLSDSVSGFVGDLWAKISTGLSDAATSLVNGLSAAVGTIAGYVQDAITGAVTAVTSGIQSALGWIWTQVGAIAQAITGAVNAVVAAVGGFFANLTRGMLDQATAILSPASPPEEDEEAAKKMVEAMIKTLEKVTETEKKSPIAYEALVVGIASTVARFMVLKIGIEAAAAAADAAHPIKELQAYKIASGIMGVLDLPSFIGPVLAEPVRQGLLIPWQQYWAAKYTPQIPGPMDLIRFVVREVIEVEVFTSSMGLQGFSAEISGWFWEAHWVLPAFGDLRSAWWRGVIQTDQFNAYIVLHDYKPEPRREGWVSDQAMIAALSYELPGRIDARWMFEQGVIDTPQHLELTRAQGMHPDWAIRVVEAEERAAIRAELEASIRENAALYAAGWWTAEQFRNMIAVLGLGDKLTNFWVARANAMRIRRLCLDRIDSLDYAYRYDLITEDSYRYEMAALAMVGEVIEAKVVNQNLRKKGTA